VVLTIAGSDSGGAAGIAADLTTFADLGAHGACVVTAVTSQDTTGVHAVHLVPPSHVEAQLDAVFDDLPVAAAKTGMLGTADVVELVADRVGRSAVPVVVDPVMVASTGATLSDAAVVEAYRTRLFPVAAAITPNVDEARVLVGDERPSEQLAAALAACGPVVVLTGGTTRGTCTDWVAVPGERPVALAHDAVATDNDHGTGCTFSAALTVHLAHGVPLLTAVHRAAAYTTAQLRQSQSWKLGRGRGPIAHT
jgi:hydroxymethylpyrimidine/phosphomethylpyrimidine kinase